jgi:tripartite-type tricarboxylate transporter receptor subunit TctC
MPSYIPGHPNIIVQNMPGAGCMIAANYAHNVARQDGLTIGAIPPGRYTVKATYEDETKQIKNLQLAEDHRVTRLYIGN